MTTMFTKGQAVMARNRWDRERWHIGIVTEATNPENLRTGVFALESATEDCKSQMFLPHGWSSDDVRLATQEDLDSLPPLHRSWIDEQLLDFSDPKVPYLNRTVDKALKVAEIRRFGDLQRTTDAELLALKGVGKKAVADLRAWQQEREEVEA